MNIVRYSITLLAVSAVAVACSDNQPNRDLTESVAQAEKTVVVFRSSQNGGSASGTVTHYDPQSYYNLTFQAWENKVNGGPRTASLHINGFGSTSVQVCTTEQICTSYDSNNNWMCNGWENVQYCYYTQSYYYINGYGDIPTADFRVGEHTAHLTTNLADDPRFSATRCGWDAVAYAWTCTPVTGTLDVIWRDNGTSEFDTKGMTSSSYRSPYGSYTMRSNGRTSSSSADVSGTALGNAVSPLGTIGLSRETTVTKEVFVTPPASDGGGPPPPPPGDGGFGPG